MYKIYIVGLGGSGGKTLQFLMDQLSGELRERGWKADHLPRCWKFVHVDVPAQPDGRDKSEGLPATVPEQGGTYLGVTTPNDQYAQLDAGLEKVLSQPPGTALRQLVGWRPDASRVATPITLGAGQYRAVGRLATLARSGSIFQGLLAAAQDLNSAEANQDFVELRRSLGLKYGEPQSTIVMVVSSLAGGTGASMTLDVCNLLRGVQHELPHFPGGDSIAYLYTPDVFAKLDAAKTGGVNANALGTIAELMSSQAAAQVAWTKQEWSIYNAGGLPTTPGRGPRAVFPVGATNGISGSLFGDGRAVTIYRGFSRALAAIFLSESQQTQTMSYVVGNFGNIGAAPDDSELAWAPHGGQDLLAFGALGFASIGLGRDRYAEYAAQRLARLAVVKLVRGHFDTSVLQNKRTEIEARDQYAQDGYPQFLRWAGLPVSRPTTGDPLEAWVDQIWASDRRNDYVSGTLGEMFGELNHAGRRQKASWFSAQLGGLIPRYFQNVTGGSESLAQTAAQSWVPDIQTRLETAVVLAIGRWGIPVAEKIVERFDLDLRSWAQLLRANSRNHLSGAQLVSDTVGPLQTVDGQIDSSHNVLKKAEQGLRSQFAMLALRRGAAVAAELIDGLATDVVQPLIAGLADALSGLVVQEESRSVDLAASSVRTTVVQAWPEGDRVPGRFATATNEVLLEDVDTYPDRFRNHVFETFATTTMPTGLRPEEGESLALAVEQVATFLELDPSGQRPPVVVEKLLPPARESRGPVKIGRQSAWWPRLFAGAAPHQTAWYEPLFSASAILDGARLWVDRDGFPLKGFTHQGLKSYLAPAGPVGATQKERLEEDFAAKFREALQLAAPLVGVHPGMVSAVHREPVRVSYQFSAAPIQAAPAAVRQIKLSIHGDPAIDDRMSSDALDLAMAGEEANVDLPRIDIIGTYSQPYSPIVFSSLQQPIQKQWSQATGVQQRMAFWRWRRGRPLTDFAPVSPEWLQAFVTGWLVGRLTGEILTPKPGDPLTAVQVFDDKVWRHFPDPLAGVEHINKDLVGWGIPAAIIESMPLAIAQCNGDTSLTALQAYIATRRLGQELPLSGYEPHPAIHAWLVDGAPRSGVAAPQIVRPEALVATAEQRLAHAVEWLERLQISVRTKLLPKDVYGAPGNGPFSVIDRHNFRDVPREWEIAEQLYVGAEEVLAELKRPENTDSIPVIETGINDVDA